MADEQNGQPPDLDLEALKAQAKAAEDYKRDLFRFKEQAQKQAAELEAIRAKQTEAEKAQLVEKEQFKALYEREQAEKAEALKARQQAELTVQRYIVQRELVEKAAAAGIRKEAIPDLKLLDITGLKVEAVNGDIKVHGVDEWVTDLKKTRTHWFDAAGAVQFSDPKGAPAQPKQTTIEDLADLAKKDPEAYKAKLAEVLKGAKV